MHRKLLAIAVCASLPWLAATAHAQAQQDSAKHDAATTDKDTAAKPVDRLQAIQVTGSLIPKSQIDTATPVTQITSDEMKRKGFKNVADALRSLPQANGSVLDNQYTNSFTTAASTISLFGLDPGFTLILVDGHPLADYPLLYNGSDNIVDLSTIPMAMVDHIDIVPGNQSAIYGSSAIAGVVNIILKQKVEGHVLNLRGGGYSEGGGGNQRVQLVGGESLGKLTATYAFEFSNQRPIYRFQRNFMDSTADNPTLAPGATAYPSLNYWRLDGLTNHYIDPGKANCDKVADQYNGTVEYATRPGAQYGNWCGSQSTNSYGTVLNKARNYSGYVSLKYSLDNHTQLYGDLLYSKNRTDYTNGFSSFFWSTGLYVPKYIWNTNGNDFEQLQRVFTPEEVGTAADKTLQQSSYSGSVGVRGTFGDSDWAYDAYFHRSAYQTDVRYLRPLAGKVENYFLGDQLGQDPLNYSVPAYNVRLDRFYSQIPLSDILGFSDYVTSQSRTWRQDLNLQITNTDLFELPAGSVGFAAAVDSGKQFWNQPIDPRVLAGEFWGTGGTQGRGSRNNNGAAMELNVPLFRMLTASLAGRYDKYRYAGNSDGRATWKAGLEFRPFASLLIRGNYATAYRAPEMSYVFAGQSRSFSSVYDYYQCRKNYGDDVIASDNCDGKYSSVQINGSSSGNPQLKSITARSWGFGMVWSPTADFNAHIDYARIPIRNEIATRSYDGILSLEASCRLGHTVNGALVDGNSAQCLEINSLITREPATDPFNPEGLSKVVTYPINISSEVVANITAGARWRIDAGRIGNFVLDADYYRALKHTYRMFPEDAETDVLASRDWGFGTEFHHIASGSVTWNAGRVSTTLYGRRYAPTWSYDGSRQVGPWITYNASVNFEVRNNVTLSLISNNLLDKHPPRDTTFGAYPYYDQFNYNGYGRTVMAELNWKID
ncbi:TonB-dependent receptor [Rhodanobacter sp. AS-Z3]|uniref:TonB-dependent receptor domain-containing protein n=1 Tax=Rhodanobacter sp. AS-Z3 TaxID=3031330 RepID=UPI002479891D|nr:TonB-dependent receptor [Rhodanobacter sp. AS-Z3]WEN16318.1 TonB-dependent receptor [Rhodanobacter sp. AS-Z3]